MANVESGLPQALKPYVEGARQMTAEQFAKQAKSPFLVFPRSKLWDPLLLKLANEGKGGETMVVNYNVETGGIPFVCPIRKRRNDANPGILLGRKSDLNDVVVPVSSVSSQHAAFWAPDPGSGRNSWSIIDLGSRNGTFIGDDQIPEKKPYPLESGAFVRLGGNLIAWFLSNLDMYNMLQDDEKIRYYTE